MELKRNGYLMRFYFWGSFDRYFRRDSVDLCSLFWTVLLKGLACLVALAAIEFVLVGIIVLYLTEPAKFWDMILIPVAIIGAMVGLGLFFAGIDFATKSDIVKFIKGHYCPQIKLK